VFSRLPLPTAPQDQVCRASPHDNDSDNDNKEETGGGGGGGKDDMMRSLVLLVADQMRELRLENDRLHETIADLRTHTENKLATLEKECHDKTRKLEEAMAELSHYQQQQTSVTLPASAPTPRTLSTHYRSNSEVEEFIRRNLPFLSGYDSSSLILKDLTYVLCLPSSNVLPPSLTLLPSYTRACLLARSLLALEPQSREGNRGPCGISASTKGPTRWL
jgi:hypothetical protein